MTCGTEGKSIWQAGGSARRLTGGGTAPPAAAVRHARRRHSPSAAAAQQRRPVVAAAAGEAAPRRVVITGMGVVSSLGHDPTEFYGNLLAGKSGISLIEGFDTGEGAPRVILLLPQSFINWAAAELAHVLGLGAPLTASSLLLSLLPQRSTARASRGRSSPWTATATC